MSRKLLLADDSITIQKVVELILSEEDFEIKSVKTGEEALKTIPSFNPDIILADIEMPNMNGYQLCEKIKQDPSLSNIPVILLAGAFEPIDNELVDKVKADDYIIKPFESHELLSKINALLKPPPAKEKVEELAEADTLELEEVSTDEDLWEMEEIPEAAELSDLEEEITDTEEKVKIEEAIEVASLETPPVEEEVSPITEVSSKEISEIERLSKEEIEKIVEKTIDKKISSLLASFDIKEAIISSLGPSLKDSLEKVIWEVAPDLTEKILKEILKDSLESLTKAVEKVIWETVPDLAETMISKEIERIKSEF